MCSLISIFSCCADSWTCRHTTWREREWTHRNHKSEVKQWRLRWLSLIFLRANSELLLTSCIYSVRSLQGCRTVFPPSLHSNASCLVPPSSLWRSLLFFLHVCSTSSVRNDLFFAGSWGERLKQRTASFRWAAHVRHLGVPPQRLAGIRVESSLTPHSPFIKAENH